MDGKMAHKMSEIFIKCYKELGIYINIIIVRDVGAYIVWDNDENSESSDLYSESVIEIEPDESDMYEEYDYYTDANVMFNELFKSYAFSYMRCKLKPGETYNKQLSDTMRAQQESFYHQVFGDIDMPTGVKYDSNLYFLEEDPQSYLRKYDSMFMGLDKKEAIQRAYQVASSIRSRMSLAETIYKSDERTKYEVIYEECLLDEGKMIEDLKQYGITIKRNEDWYYKFTDADGKRVYEHY